MNHPRRILAAVVLTWLAAALFLIWSGLADGEIVCDDGYYYFEIARNAARGEGFTFDGLGPTNGFHPLWAWLLVPVYALFPTDPWTPIHVAVSLSALFTAATAVVGYLLFERHGRTRAGLLAAGLWLFNPFTWVLFGRGLEGPLHTLCIALTFLFLDHIRGKGVPSVRQALGLGALLGLCLLARTDSVLLVAAVAVVLVVDVARAARWSELPSRVGACAATAALVVSPWVIWNLATFGTVMQTSFRAKSLFHLYGQLPPLGEGAAVVTGALRNLHLIALYNAKYIAFEEWTEPQDGWTVLFVALALVAALALAPLVPRVVKRAGGRPFLGPMAVFCAVHFGWYAWIGLNYYNWYFLPPVFAFCLFAGDRLDRIAAAGRAGRGTAFALAAGVALTAPLLVSRHLEGEQRRGDERLFERVFAPRFAATPPGARTGAWNAGLVGYFASFHFPDRVVINLDGLVNNDVPPAAAEGLYERYLLENVEWILEPPDSLLMLLPREQTMRFVQQHITPDGRVVR